MKLIKKISIYGYKKKLKIINIIKYDCINLIIDFKNKNINH